VYCNQGLGETKVQVQFGDKLFI